MQVSSQYKKEINVKIQGTGVGGCDILLSAGQSNNADCWCLWGTINYSFCAYYKSGVNDAPQIAQNTTVGAGKCPMVTGETLLCSDLSSLGNCYDKGYSCTVNENGLCHCDKV